MKINVLQIYTMYYKHIMCPFIYKLLHNSHIKSNHKDE